MTKAPLAPDEARQAVIGADVLTAVRDDWTVQSLGAGQAVRFHAKQTGLFLVLMTGGRRLFWIVYRALNRKTMTLIVSVDAYDRVTHR